MEISTVSICICIDTGNISSLVAALASCAACSWALRGLITALADGVMFLPSFCLFVCLSVGPWVRSVYGLG